MTVRWIFTDLVTSDTYTPPINPNKMTTITGRKATTSVPGDTGPLTITVQPRPIDFSFGGVMYDQEHYDALAELVERRHPYRITDHLGRTFDVLLNRFEPEDRPPRPGKGWRHNYTVTGTLLWVGP